MIEERDLSLAGDRKNKFIGLKLVDIQDDDHGGYCFEFENHREILLCPKLDYNIGRFAKLEFELSICAIITYPSPSEEEE